MPSRGQEGKDPYSPRRMGGEWDHGSREAEGPARKHPKKGKPGQASSSGLSLRLLRIVFETEAQASQPECRNRPHSLLKGTRTLTSVGGEEVPSTSPKPNLLPPQCPPPSPLLNPTLPGAAGGLSWQQGTRGQLAPLMARGVLRTWGGLTICTAACKLHHLWGRE